ncbi:MAG: response regulator [Desulfobaccales bacterium]|nr:response regulator [Desulfobaccales bacterium]
MAPVTILLVDDDPLIRSLGKELLERLGYRVAVAEDGAEALTVWRRLGGVDLVILDYNLSGQDGCQVLGQLRTLDPGVRVLMVSGFFSSQDVARLKEEGARGLIYKPYRVAELQSRIQKVLSGLEGF